MYFHGWKCSCMRSESGPTFERAEVFHRLNSEEMFAPAASYPCARARGRRCVRGRARALVFQANPAASWHRLNRQISPIPDGPQLASCHVLFITVPLAFVSCFRGPGQHRRAELSRYLTRR